MAQTVFTRTVIELIRAVPQGKVATYGGIARLAGSPRAARQVVRVLHSSSQKQGLPWHRVINREGKISLSPVNGGELQRRLLEREGAVFDAKGAVDLAALEWKPDPEFILELRAKIERDDM